VGDSGRLALLVPRLARLKEWAYAGAFFTYTSSGLSLLVGDRASQWAGPLILSLFALVSWILRPPSRRLPKLAPVTEVRVAPWAVPILIVGAMLAVAWFTLPKGAPAQ
jgi:hypothetical protein